MKLTIICPTFNSAKVLGRSLRSWLGQDYPKDQYEILIIDRSSLDDTKQIVEEFSKTHKNLKYVESPPRTSTQRNNGIKIANGDTILLFDDDSVPEPGHFRNGVKFLEENKEIDIVGGPQVTSSEDGFFAQAAGAAMTSFFGSFTMARRYRKSKPDFNADEFSLTTANVFIRKSVFGKIGGFDETMYPGEDPEFFARAKTNKIKMAFLPDIAAQHGRRTNLKAFMKQHFNYGMARPSKEKLAKTPFPKNLMFAIPSFFLIYCFLLPGLLAMNILFAVPPIFYLAAAFLFGIWAAANNKIPLALPLMPFLFFFMHASYGAGYLSGLFKKIQTNKIKN